MAIVRFLLPKALREVADLERHGVPAHRSACLRETPCAGRLRHTGVPAPQISDACDRDNRVALFTQLRFTKKYILLQPLDIRGIRFRESIHDSID